MKLNQRVLVTSVFALLIFNSSVAQAWDWNSLKERSIQSVKAWWYGSGTSTQSSVSSASIHRKPELTVFGPKTYFVGDPITSDMFRVDNSARHKMNVRASGHVQVDYVLNGQKHRLVVANAKHRHTQTVQLIEQNTLQIVRVMGKQNESVTFSFSTRDIQLRSGHAALSFWRSRI